jgi:hypothetical protein
MSATVPFIALSALIGLSFGAKHVARVMPSAGRQILTGLLAVGLLASFWIFG